MLGRNVFILEIFGFLKCALQNLVQRLAHVLLREALNSRQLANLLFNFLRQVFAANSQARQKRRHHAVSLRGQRSKQMNGFDLLVFVLGRDFLRSLYGLLGLDRHFFKSQHNNLVSRCLLRKKGPALGPALFSYHSFLRITFLQPRPSPALRH